MTCTNCGGRCGPGYSYRYGIRKEKSFCVIFCDKCTIDLSEKEKEELIQLQLKESEEK